MRLFLDANVLFSAALSPAGRARALFDLASSTPGTLCASPHAIAEAERNIELKYPGRLTELEGLIARLSRTAEATPSMAEEAARLGLPQQDAPILAAAIQARVGLLVTGDRTHFGHLYGKTVQGVEIVTPADALARLLLRVVTRVDLRDGS